MTDCLKRLLLRAVAGAAVGGALLTAAMGAAHAAPLEGDAVRGKSVYVRCITCHALNGAQFAGPSLIGVVGRAAHRRAPIIRQR